MDRIQTVRAEENTSGLQPRYLPRLWRRLGQPDPPRSACTTSGSSDSSAAGRTNGGVFRKVLSPFATGFRVLDALIDVSLSHARSNPHQVFIRIK